jgi:hypothetical protein
MTVPTEPDTPILFEVSPKEIESAAANGAARARKRVAIRVA